MSSSNTISDNEKRLIQDHFRNNPSILHHLETMIRRYDEQNDTFHNITAAQIFEILTSKYQYQLLDVLRNILSEDSWYFIVDQYYIFEHFLYFQHRI